MPPRRGLGALALVLICAWAEPAPAADVIGPAVTTTFAADGTLWRATPRRRWLEVDSSTDRGATFSAPRRVNPRPQHIRATPEDRPSISVDAAGRVFVTWAADDPAPWTRFIAWSGDGGRTFAPPLRLNPEDVVQNQTVVRATGDGGADVLSLGARNDQAAVATLVLGRFGPGLPASPAPQTLHQSMCECCRFAVQPVADGGWAVFGRLVLEGGARDMGLVAVHADGRASARRVTDDDWVIQACPEHGPALAIGAGGRHHLAWFTQGARRQGLFYAWSDDAGATLSAPVAIGSRARLAGHADVGVLGETVAVAWQEYDGRRTTVHAMLSTDDGRSWGPAREVAGAVGATDYPFVLTDGRALYLSWYANDTGLRLHSLAETAR